MFFGILIFDPNWPFCKGYIAFAWWASYKMVSFLEYLAFFEAVFCKELLWRDWRIDFCMFFGILIFDPNWPFSKGYSLCMMGELQNGLICRIFSVFFSGFLHRTTLTWLENRFLHVFWNFNFWPELTILQRPLHDGRVTKWSHFSNI